MFGLKLFSRNSPQKAEKIYLQHMPKEYISLATAKNIEEVIALAHSLETIEEHHSPRAYSDWYVSLLNITYPTQGLWLRADTVKIASAPLVPIFASAQTNFESHLLDYRISLHSQLPCQESIKGRSKELFTKGPISASLLQIPTLHREKFAFDQRNSHLERSRGGGMGIETVYIDSNWIESFDNLSLLWNTELHLVWYRNRFTNVSQTGSLLNS